MAFCPSVAGKTALRWAKPGFLPIRSRKNSLSLGKTGQQPGARRAFRRAPRSARAVAAGSRSFRRRCPAPVYPLFTPAFSLPSPAFAPPNPQNPQNSSGVPQKPPFLVSRARENCPLYPKTSHFGVPPPRKLPVVPQKPPFWGPAPAKLVWRTPKPAILVSRTSEKSPLYPKTSHFGVRNPAVRAPRAHFCLECAQNTG